MLDHVCVMTYGGVVLFSWTASQAAGDGAVGSCVDGFVRDVLVEDRAGAKEHVVGERKVRWSFGVEAQILVVAVFQRFLQFVRIDEFLQQVRMAFERCVLRVTGAPQGVLKNSKAPELATLRLVTGGRGAKNAKRAQDFAAAFDAEFHALLAAFEGLQQGERPAPLTRPTADDLTAPDFRALSAEPEAAETESPPADEDADLNGTLSGTMSGTLSKVPSKVLVGRGGRKLGKPDSAASLPATPAPRAGAKPKAARSWNAITGAAEEGAAAAPAPTQPEPTEEEREEALQRQAESQRKQYIRVDEAGRALTVNAQDWSDQVKQRGRLGAWLRGLGIANRTLEAGDLATLLPKLADRLVAKNVAVDVATAITKSLETSLEGTRIGSFQSLETLLEGALVEALRRILRPKVEINVLRAVDAAKQRKRPYVITFCGVNGVGKSTTLSKIAFWLQQNGHSLMIAAGDTFRHGAVEQVMTHGRCLNVPVFHMGYGTDPSEVTKNAVQLAQKQGVDVVLVDTAGRMQDHEPRMRALARLIHENNPDLVLFVGEAIVGNNGVDQLRKFNQCLHDFTPVGREPRGIDGLVLTKFDTINDKVGAAVSMVYELRQPIVFVGVGQTYQDLKTIEPEVVVDALMQ